ncbi:helix-turn-helix domain-containing protein [Streptomyces sp. NPDC058268]|uniref:helix-turn-helix domain-containing protein n=1 Tax=Streptomyces sp. NPDC058268 TaxID=3346413 RepID=UPI0036E01EB0
MPDLADRNQSGRPPTFAAPQIAEVKALACQLPAETGVPLSRGSCPKLAAELTTRGITDSVSTSTVRRWLAQDTLKPWQYRSWIFITGPDFRAKAQRMLDLYARTWQGEPLGTEPRGLSARPTPGASGRVPGAPRAERRHVPADGARWSSERGGAKAVVAERNALR